MHFTAAVALLAGLAGLACAEDAWFKEYTTTDCSDSDPTYYDSGDLRGAEVVGDIRCTPIDSGTVAIRGHWNDWLSGTLVAYASSGCTGTELGNIPYDTSDCWAVGNFSGWGQTVGSIGLVSVGM